MAAAETRSSGRDTVNCRALEIRTDSIRLVASRKLQSSIFGAVIRQERAVPLNNGHSPKGRLRQLCAQRATSSVARPPTEGTKEKPPNAAFHCSPSHRPRRDLPPTLNKDRALNRGYRDSAHVLRMTAPSPNQSLESGTKVSATKFLSTEPNRIIVCV